MKKSTLIICGLILFSNQTFSAELQCPSTISVNELPVSASEWVVKQTKPTIKKLQTATLYVGKLSDTESPLAPEEKQQGKVLLQTWDLITYWQQKQNIWLECRYNNSEIVLSQNVPNTFKHCQQDFQLDKKHNPVNSSGIVCR